MHSMVLRVRGSCYDKELIFLLVLYFCNKIKIENCLITGILIKKAFGTICIQKLVRNSVTRKGVTCDVYEEEQSSVLMSLWNESLISLSISFYFSFLPVIDNTVSFYEQFAQTS